MTCAKRAGIVGVGSAVPDKVLTNFDLEKMVDTSDEWIRTMTGVSERRIAAEGETTSQFAVGAARTALGRANLSPEEIDLIIVATFTGDTPLPATACILQNALGCRTIPAFDVSAGCSGFVYGLATADAFVRSGAYERVLVVGVDLLSRVTNWTDRTTCVLFGDGAGAAIVAPVEEGQGFLAFDLGADGAGANLLDIPGGGPYTAEDLAAHRDRIHMEGREVFKFAVKVQGEATDRLLARCGITTADIDLLIPHQANIRIIDSAANRLELPPEKLFVNINKYGNTSAGSIAIALDEAVGEGKIRKGDTVVAIAFGSGLTWAGSVMKWAF